MKSTLLRRVTSLGIKGFSIVVTFLVAKLYISTADAAHYGNYILNHGYLITVGTLAGMGQGILVIRKLSSTSLSDLTIVLRGYLSVLIYSAVVTLLAMMFVPLVEPEYITVSKVLSCWFYAFSMFNFELVRVWSNGNVYIFFKDILRAIILMIVLFVNPFTEIDRLLLITSAGMMVTSLVFIQYQVWCRKTTLAKVTMTDVFTDMKEALSISLGSGLQVFKGWVEIFLAGAFLTESMVGLYSLLLRLGKLVSLPLVALNSDIARQLSVIADGGEYTKQLRQNIRITRYFGVLFGFGAILGAHLFIEFYDFEYDVLSALAATLLIAGNTVNVLFGPVGFLAQLGSMRSTFNIATLLSIVTVVVFTTLLVCKLNIVALALASLIAGIGWNIVLSKKMKTVVGFRF